MEQLSNGNTGRGSHSRAAAENLKALRMDIIAPLFKKGYNYREMREEVMARLNLRSYSLSTVKHDVEALLKEWRETRIENVDLNMQLELQRIDDIVKEAWAAWEKSKEDYQKQRARQEAVPVPDESGQGAEPMVTRMSQEREDVRACGDPRYLDIINKALAERRKLLGIYAPEKNLVATDMSFASFLMRTGQKKKEN